MTGFTRFIGTVLGLSFVVAGYVKIMDPEGFAVAVANYQLLPDHLVRSASIILAWTEMICGLCLIFKICTKGAALIVTVLMIIFLSAMGYNLHRGLDVSCGCFSTGPDGPPLSPLTLVRDVALLLVALWVYLGNRSNSSHRHR